jgi:ATP-binding cassette subfamily C exporter for protease/lipase
MEQLEMPPEPQQADCGQHSGTGQTDDTSGMPLGIDLAALQAGRSSLQAAKVPTVEPAMEGNR